MTYSAALLNHLTLALHPDLTPQQRLFKAKQATLQGFQQNRRVDDALPQPTEAILHWHAQSLKWLTNQRTHRAILHPGDSAYPAHLFDLPRPPMVLFCEGNLGLLEQPGVSLVGSRNASRLGLASAHDFSRDLSAAGWCVISGLAQGIDGASHRGALDARGPTIAVLGGATDCIYPRQHTALAQEILAQDGLIISEYPPGTEPRRGFFPQRNRLIAALGQGVLVVEAARRSGSLITARVASELGRLVMALPGSIHSTHSKGCHDMIKKGALLIETTEEIIQELSAGLSNAQQAQIKLWGKRAGNCGGGASTGANNLRQTPSDGVDLKAYKVLEHLDYEPMHTDQLALLAGLPAPETAGLLIELEVQGHVSSEAGNRWVKMP